MGSPEYKDRVTVLRDDYHTMVRANQKAQRHLDKLRKLFPEDLRSRFSINVYNGSCFIYGPDMKLDTFEDEYMLPITMKFKCKWDRKISEASVTYNTEFFANDAMVYMTFRCDPVEGVCEILRVETGRTKKVSKYVEVEEPEVEYLVKCGGA